MKNSGLQDLFAALSLANLSFLDLWDGLLNYTPAQSFFLEHAPPRTEYLAAFANVILLGLVFFLLIRFARWIGTRYGAAGLILGSLPVLLLISLPAAKSLVRMLLNRFPDWDLKLLIGVLALLIAVLTGIARRRFLGFASAALVTMAPLMLIEAIVSIQRCRADQPEIYADGPLAPRVPQTSRPRIVWIIFDELDYRLSFVDRASNVGMQSFDRLRAESLFAENAISPGSDTIPSVPSLLTGNTFTTSLLAGPATLLLDGVSASALPTVFSSVHAMGGNAAAVGWYLPYCRLFSRDLASCSAHHMENELNETGSTFERSLLLQLQSVFAYGYRSILGQSPRAKYRIEMLNDMHKDALRDVVDPSLNLVFLHFPLPHAPYLYDRFSYTFPKRYLGVGSYLDNLVLADIFLGDIRESMTVAGLWDKTTVIVSSDHPDRMSEFVDGRSDSRVPFLLKLAGQTSGTSFAPVLPTVITKSLVEAILEGKITTSKDAENWLLDPNK